ncbi:helix-turn-helix transcriptional regulator [Kitasatospora sp. NPDC004799]|uniref:helix-turn-helix domain-containing protein n=1 Tax=Kitasatospora sp. NPDC004799 TaxID=3154460 RepID=UPI0033B11AE4
MAVEAGLLGSGTEQQDWEEEPEVVRTIARQIKLWRERAGFTQAGLGLAIGFSEELVAKVECGQRIPTAQFLEKVDEAVNAGGMVAAFKADLVTARYPKKVRDLAKLEAESVEIGAYSNHNIQGLLQTEDYTRALFKMRRPLLDEETIERQVAARMARQVIFERWPAPILSFVQEEATLRCPLGGREVLRGVLERMLEIGQLRNVEIQVMPTDREDHAGMGGQLCLFETPDGLTVAHTEVQQFSRVIADRKHAHVLKARYGIIRAQALTPRESMTFIEKLLGET